jgi:hypothetical protein
MNCWRPYCVVGVHIVLLASLLMLILLLANLYYFWLLAVAGLPSAVDVCDVPMVSASVAEWFRGGGEGGGAEKSC